MRSIWEINKLPHKDRKKIHERKLRQMVIGAYAPLEPHIMSNIKKYLEKEEKYPLGLVHQILDRLSSMSITTTIATHEEVRRFIETMPDDYLIARGPCACRRHTAEELGPDAMDFANGKLEFCRQTPLNVDIQIAACGEEFGKLDSYEHISKKELLELEEECLNMGLVSNLYMFLGGEAGICHCSSPTCVPFTANRYIDSKTKVIIKGELISNTDMEICSGAGNCVKVCHFAARKLESSFGQNVLSVDMGQCYGCGLCVHVCPEKAITMVPRSRKNAGLAYERE